MDEAKKDVDTIIVVEPDVLVRMIIGQYLRECGYKVIEGTQAQDVWTVFESGAKVDIVFAEVRLPGDTDGFALARKIRQTQPTIDVILTTSLAAAAEKSKDLR